MWWSKLRVYLSEPPAEVLQWETVGFLSSCLQTLICELQHKRGKAVFILERAEQIFKPDSWLPTTFVRTGAAEFCSVLTDDYTDGSLWGVIITTVMKPLLASSTLALSFRKLLSETEKGYVKHWFYILNKTKVTNGLFF